MPPISWPPLVHAMQSEVSDAGGAACAFSLGITGQVLHVPYRSLIELRAAAYTKDAAPSVSGHPPAWMALPAGETAP